jgi:molybdenum cofactor cytidylyltransferase
MQTPRFFAIVPAAGHSVRMGQAKLLMPLGGRPLIVHALAAWLASKVDRVIVVVRPDDAALAEVVRAAGAEVTIPATPPADMKASIACGLAHIEACYNPTAGDFWLVAPADMPGLSPRIIDRVIAHAANFAEAVVIPTVAGRRGHPVLLPWSIAGEIERLGVDEGLDALIKRYQPSRVQCDDLAAADRPVFGDIDTPADLAAFSQGKAANTKLPPAN